MMNAQPAPRAEDPGGEATLRLMLAQVPAAVWTFDRDLRFTSVQGSALTTRGYDAARFIGMSLFEFHGTTDESHPSIRAHRRALQGESSAYESRVWGCWWDSHVEPLRDAAGQIIGVVGISVESTGRKEAERRQAAAQEALSASEARMRLITSQLPAILWSTDRELHVTMAHGALLPVLGLPPDRLVGASVLDVVGAVDRSHPEVVPYVRALAGHPVAYETTFAGRALDVHLDPLRNLAGEVIGTVGVALDISARRQAEQLRDAAQRELQDAYQSLEQRVAERTRELSTLLKISADVASTLELKPLIRLILDRLELMTNSSGAALSIVDGEDMIVLDSRGVSEDELASQGVSFRYPAARMGAIWEAIRQGQAVIIDDVHDDSPLAADYRKALGPLAESALRDVGSWLGVPLMRHGRVAGLLSESYPAPHYYTSHGAELAAAIAHQAAIAIENARLYAEAEAKAALEERQRLARELHDSVSQALYSILLGAETAREYLQIDPARAAAPLEYVAALANAGLAEMKALIFELRPESLEKEGLVAALTKQAAALQARHALEVKTELSDEPPLALEAKEALYRIAQEAMHNVVKHAEAAHIEVRLACTEDMVMLEVRDDGLGFDPTADYAGHLGLKSMCERAWRAGGALSIDSSPARGACVRVTLPLAPK